MLFTIVIPTYNPGTYLPRLLNSILKNECLSDMEVILSDDCSTEKLEDAIVWYKSLNIRIIRNDRHYGFPRAGRQNGADAAKGQWVCFADQDDCFVENAFDKIKAYILKHNAANYLTTDFITKYIDSGKQIVNESTHGWTHGKFYEKSFLDKYDIRYDDIQYCEDINLSTKVGCVMAENMLETYHFNEPVYIWMRRNDSLCDVDYFIRSMPDYICATAGVLITFIEKHKDDEDQNLFKYYNTRFINTLYHTFFYLQSPQLFGSKRVIHETCMALIPIYERFQKATGLTSDDILYLTYNDLLPIYHDTRNNDFRQIPFIEQMTFREWMVTHLG